MMTHSQRITHSLSHIYIYISLSLSLSPVIIFCSLSYSSSFFFCLSLVLHLYFNPFSLFFLSPVQPPTLTLIPGHTLSRSIYTFTHMNTYVCTHTYIVQVNTQVHSYRYLHLGMYTYLHFVGKHIFVQVPILLDNLNTLGLCYARAIQKQAKILLFQKQLSLFS